MIITIKKISELINKTTKTKFLILFILLMVKALLDGFGIGLIAPYVVVVRKPEIVFDYPIFVYLNNFIKLTSNTEVIIFVSAILITFFIVKNFFTIYVVYFQAKLVYTERSVLGSRLFNLYMNAPYTYHLEHNTAEFDRNIKFEIPRVYSFVQSILLLVSNLFLTLSIFIILLIANWKIVLLLGCVLMAVSAIIISISGRYNKKYGQEVQESQLHIGQSMKEGLQSIIEVKIHGIEKFFPSMYFRSMLDNARAIWKQSTLGAVPTLFFEVIAVFTLAGMVIIMSFKGINIDDLLPILALFSFAFIRLIPAVTSVVKSFQQIKYQIPSVDIVHEDFCRIGEMIRNKDVNNNEEKNIDFDELELRDVSFSFLDIGPKIISDITIKIEQGQSIGITGPSGSGKTTLMNLILGLLKPKNGKVLVNGVDIQKNRKNWRSLIGYVPQSITLIDASIKENIGLGLKNNQIDEKKVWSVLIEANLDIFVRDLPEQLDTVIGENGIRLSGGQRQRLGLARTLYRNPEVLIFDEATSSLDIDTEKKITKEIMALSGNRTLIIVAHRISTIKKCDIIYYLKDGVIIDSGSFSELKKINKDFGALVNTAGAPIG